MKSSKFGRSSTRTSFLRHNKQIFTSTKSVVLKNERISIRSHMTAERIQN
jgi:hypothetical protein